jgi:hypothetical protein
MIRYDNHKEPIIGACIVLLLTTKPDAKPIYYDKFCRASIKQHDDIQSAFKEALVYVSHCYD